jgi:adenylate cyclase
VLPFKNLSADPDQEFFADGITEDIITELLRDKDLFLIARHSTMAYKGQSLNVREVAKNLGVKYVLEGSIRRSGNRIRLNAQLIEGQTNHHIWAEKYDRSLEDIFEVQDNLTSIIMNTLLEKINSPALRERYVDLRKQWQLMITMCEDWPVFINSTKSTIRKLIRSWKSA